jgi:hypothetical protein
MIVNIAEVWADVAGPHVDFVNARIDEFLWMELPMRRKADDVEARAFDFILRYRGRIASATDTDFSRLIKVFEGRFPEETGERAWAIALFKSVFDYGKFSDKYSKDWNAYDLCNGTKWKVCPYCHIHGTETAIPDEDMEGGYRPQIDHYYPQSKYPFLGLTLGNLIPCCAQCNGPGFKHIKNFYEKPHLNPLSDVENVGFRIEGADAAKSGDPVVTSFRGALSDYRIAVFALAPCTKTEASLVTFQLGDRYQQYKDEAYRICSDVLQKKEALAQWAKTVDVANRLPDATSRDMMRASLFEFSFPLATTMPFDPDHEHQYKNHIAGKMKRDIFLRVRDG